MGRRSASLNRDRKKPTPQGLPLVRRVTTSNGQKLTDQLVQMNGNPANVLAGGGPASATPAGRRSSTAS